MTSRERIKNIINKQSADRCGFWLGNPHPDSWQGLHNYFGTRTEEELRLKLGDDFRWITPQYLETTYQHPDGNGLFDIWKYKSSLNEAGPLANVESINEIENYDWPKIEYLNFEECISILKNTGDFYRASGFWMPFFHDVCDLFGMENLMIKMFTNPDVVHSAINKVCSFYYEANEKFYREAGNLVDALFFGNDFGTQYDLLITPQQFEDFFLPWIKKFSEQAKQYNLQVIKHSCGSVFKIIDKYIESGIDCLHPLQAKAKDMNAENLAQHFKEKITFLGGIDTQDLLVNGTPQQVKEEVKRIKDLLGPNLIVSPSHEAILPNIPPKNIAAMAEEAIK